MPARKRVPALGKNEAESVEKTWDTTRIVKTELLTEGLIPLSAPVDDDSKVTRLLRWLGLKPAVPEPEFLNLFSHDMSAYRFTTLGGAVATVPFSNDLTKDADCDIKTMALSLALPSLHKLEQSRRDYAR